MLLKKIEIYGFKSFAERVTLKFERGITAIVGPNGCGKSNVADAVRWVLGEQSAKSLRGSRMEDIIFSGTQVRKSLGFAEVSLTLDNTEGSLPLEYTEVTVTRRVFRSGDSEYYINRSSCRLKDIVELFMDTGVGKEGYSIIGQGRIDEILSTRSEDRRYIFEEAAGIVKYKTRREEAEKKLQKTRDNLTRVDDILTELAMQIAPLEDQARVAKVYLDLREELKAFEINRFIHQYDRNTARMDTIKAEMTELEHALTEQKGQQEAKEQEKEGILLRLAALAAETEGMRKERYDLLNQGERLQGCVNLLEEKIQQCGRDVQRLLQEMEGEQARIASKEARRQETETRLSQAAARRAALYAAAEEQHKGLEAIEAERSRHQAEMDARKGSILEILNAISECRSQITRYHTIEQNLMSRQGTLKGLMDTRRQERDRREAEGLQAVNTVEALTQDLQEAQSNKSKLEAEAADMKGQLSAVETRLNQDKQELEGRRSRLKLLKDMQQGYEGYQKSVREILLACRDQNSGGRICGVVAELLRVPQAVETAVETSLGASLQHIVTEREEDAKELIEFLRRHNYGRATFLPISSIRGRRLTLQEQQVLKMPGCVGTASELVAFDEKYREIMENLLGRVVIAEDLDCAIQMARRFSYAFRMVTLKGDILHTGGSLTGGSSAVRGLGILSRIREIEFLQKGVVESTQQLDRDAAHQNRLGHRYRQLKQDLEEASARLLEIERARSAALEQAGRIQMQKEQAEKELNLYQGEQAQILENLTEAARQIASGEEKLRGLEHQRGHISQNAADTEQALRDREREKDALSKAYGDSRVHIASLDREIHSLTEDIEHFTQDIAQIHQALSEKEEQRAAIVREAEEKKTEREQALEQMAALTRKTEEKQASIRLQEEKRRDLEEKQFAADQAIKTINALIQDVTDRKYKQEVQWTRLEAELENLQNNMWEEYSLTYANALPYKDHTLTQTGLVQDIQRLKEEIGALGTVHVNAIEEYKRLRERLTFLQEQRADLISAADHLKGIIKDITQTMEVRFKKEFAVINGYFCETFAQLFGGGTAALVLEDSSDVLSCGIDITAQPPGKKLQSLSLLSGGERALTAIAILFAILKHKPTPFCVLDEIDAALDETNVDHFSRFVRAFSEDTQFVIITHRKGTMEVCDCLYGIAMEEKGVSKLISVRFEEQAV